MSKKDLSQPVHNYSPRDILDYDGFGQDNDSQETQLDVRNVLGFWHEVDTNTILTPSSKQTKAEFGTDVASMAITNQTIVWSIIAGKYSELRSNRAVEFGI